MSFGFIEIQIKEKNFFLRKSRSFHRLKQIERPSTSSEVPATCHLSYICNTALLWQLIMAQPPPPLTTNLEDYPLLYVRNCSFSTFISKSHLQDISVTHYPTSSNYVRRLQSLAVHNTSQSFSQILLHECHWPVCLTAAIVSYSYSWTH